MVSYIQLTIDTIVPTIEVFAPSFTTRDTMNTIIVQADEPLSDFQDFYFIDANQVRHDGFTFHKEDEFTYVGRLQLINAPIGILTFFASVKDEVGNRSSLVSTTINVVEESRIFMLTINDRPLINLDISSRESKVNSEVIEAKVDNWLSQMRLEEDQKAMEIKETTKPRDT